MGSLVSVGLFFCTALARKQISAGRAGHGSRRLYLGIEPELPLSRALPDSGRCAHVDGIMALGQASVPVPDQGVVTLFSRPNGVVSHDGLAALPGGFQQVLQFRRSRVPSRALTGNGLNSGVV